MSRFELTFYVYMALLAITVAITRPMHWVGSMLLIVFGLLAFKHVLTEQ